MSTVHDRLRDLRSLPWPLVQKALWLARRGYWRNDRPTGRYLFLDTTTRAVTRALGTRGYHPNWELSAYYEGEDLNLSNPRYEPAKGVAWWQNHCRGWEEDGGISLKAHWEPEPSENPFEHLDPETYGRPVEGMRRLRETLDDAGLHYEERQYE